MFKEFESVGKAEWVEKLMVDLKGKDPEILLYNDEIEGIDVESYQHKEDYGTDNSAPSVFPCESGFNRSGNQWSNGLQIIIKSEEDANKEALGMLMKGVDFIDFRPSNNTTDWSKVLDGIMLEHINTHFDINTVNDLKILLALIPSEARQRVTFGLDPLLLSESELSEAFSLIKDVQFPIFKIDACQIEFCGGNNTEQLSFALNLGHEMLLNAMNHGLSIDEATACLHFYMGSGSNYLIESVKLSALRANWSKIVHSYNPEHSCSHRCYITTVIGHVNKSLQDPYTNLLRQTTEGMSAVNGGTDRLVILPYDQLSTSGASDLAKRMAVNISLILKEESHLDKVINPLGGSYVFRRILNFLESNSWDLFLQLEDQGGLVTEKGKELLYQKIKETAQKRIDTYAKGKRTLIGVNKYPDPVSHDLEWVELKDTYLGLDHIILEKEIKELANG